MKIRELIKRFVGKVRCTVNFVKCPKGGVYIGKNVHIVNGKYIKLGKNVQIRPYCDLFAAKTFVIGEGCDIGIRNRIAGNVIIEDNVLFGPDNFVCSYDHTYSNPDIPIISQEEHEIKKNGHSELKIGRGSWIGIHCVIMGDVHIGTHCVIGANSVVTNDIPDYCVVVGSPCRVVKQYDFQKKKWINIPINDMQN